MVVERGWQPIVWTNDAKRITALFTSEHEGRITLHSLGQYISFNIDDGEDVNAVRRRIGEVLSGQPVGDTYKILEREFGG